MITRDEFSVLKLIHGKDVVFNDNTGFYFSLSSNLMEQVNIDSDIIKEYKELEQLCEVDRNILFLYAYGDDIATSICVKTLEAINNIPGLEEFILSNVGANCYTSGDCW